jgi:hypothetical protein
MLEEVNHLEAGQNYGWSVMEGTACHFGTSCTLQRTSVPPRAAQCNRFTFDAACAGAEDCAIIGGYVYRGTDIPGPNGWYVYSDFCARVAFAPLIRNRLFSSRAPGGSGLNPTSFRDNGRRDTAHRLRWRRSPADVRQRR